ncbi:MAG TPA: hypothetical protein VFG03_19400 [Telluria sp.]|nr:hypothetical protein [Telluria sp.]
MKALLVDDDIVSRMALIDLLSVYGIFELVEAEDGEAAWALLDADRINRALADVADAVGRQLDRVKALASSGAPDLTGAMA